MIRRNVLILFFVFTLILTVFTQVELQAADEDQQSAVENKLPNLFVIGDSTASNGSDLGWGSHLADYFDSSKINVFNRARGGRSSRTFQTEGLWDQVLEKLTPGDFVLIQFGHNDGGSINDKRRARGSLRGLGEQTQEIDNLQTGKHEIVHTFGWYMRKFIADTKAKGATPIILSLTVRNEWRNGRVERGSGNYSQWSAQIAQSQNAAFVDLTNIIADQYELLGQARVASFFPRDHTHTSAEAANFNAALVVSGLKTLKDCPLTNCLSARGNNITAYNPDVFLRQTEVIMTETWHPNSQPVSNPNLPTLFLIGDSTVRTGRRGDGENGQWGWGAPIADFFDRNRINVENHAMGGTSSRTYQSSGLWDRVLANMKSGDFVIMQFGHNDGGPLNDNRRARGTIKGNGEQTEEIDNLLTGKHEVVHTYGWYIRKYINDAKSKGATPIVCSLIPRNRWDDGKNIRSSDDYAKWAAEAAKAQKAAFINLNEIIAAHYEQQGQEKVTAFYFGFNERTHTNAAGATLNAYCLIEGLRGLKNCTLCDYFLPVVEKIGK
jgi:lysophospholipase L1-like esterase